MFPRSEFYCHSIFAGLVAWFSPRMERYCRIVKRVDSGKNIASTARCHHGMDDGMIGLILSDAPGHFFRWGIGKWHQRSVVLAINGAMFMSWWLFSSIFYHVLTLSHRPFCICCTDFGVLWSQVSEYIYEMGRTTAAIPNWERTQVYKWYHIRMSRFLAQ